MDNNDKFNQLLSFQLTTEDEIDSLASLFSEFAFCLDPFIDTYELNEALNEYLTNNPALNFFSIQIMAQIARACVDRNTKHWN